MNNTISCVSHDQCTGCGACYNKCPRNAIQMQPDRDGFLYPQIQEDLCVDCGLCVKSCPVINPDYSNEKEPECYAVMASDEIRMKSSSGGVFTLLAEWVLGEDGIVCGAAPTDDNYTIHHVLISNPKELEGLRGSKYVQSDIGWVYTQIKNALEIGKKVLFTGTPCQVAGIRGFLGKDYSNLYTLDLVCHGVPSPRVYEQYIRELEKEHNAKAVRVSFRDKSVVKWDVSTTVEFDNGLTYHASRNKDPYLKAFLKLLMLRKCCGKCLFAQLPRQGDLTIADFWDIHRYKAELDDRKGTSMVLVNNDKGRVMLKVLEAKSQKFKKAPLEHAIKYNAQIKYSSLHHPRRDRFYDLFSNYHYNTKKAIDYGMNRRFDIGLVGWWYGANYGSVMTSFALNRVLTSMGKSVLMLEWPVLNGEIPKKKPDSPARRFGSHFYETSMLYHLNDYGRFNYHCETFVVGSDQLWNWYSNRDVGTYHFFLDFVDGEHKKIAYSTSFGHEYVHYPQDMRIKVSYYLQRFDAISVREKSAVDVCKHDFDVEAEQTMDPVFLCDMKSYEEACSLSKIKLDHPYVLAYILNPTKEKIEAIRLTAEKKGLPYYIILDGQADFEEQKKLADDPNVLPPLEIADWLNYIRNADFVVTDSFHGYCYSIIFKRNMAVFPNKLRGLARFETISELAGLNDRLIYSFEEYVNSELWNKEIDYVDVDARMKPEIIRSRQWLEEALEMRKRPPSVKKLYLWKAMVFDRLAHVLKTEGNLHKNELEISNIGVSRNDEIDDLKKMIKHQSDEIQKLNMQMDKIMKLPRRIKRLFKRDN